MNISNMLVILLIFNTCCFGSEEKPAETQSLWSYFKYVSPLYYWKKYQINMIEYKLERIKQENIQQFDEEIEQHNADKNLLEPITSADDLPSEKKFKTKFVRDYLPLLKNPKDETFSELKNRIIKELERIISTFEGFKTKKTTNDQEIIELEEQKQQLQQRMQEYK